ncbi:MAG: hypothetical protein ABIZ04_25555 [Opitutus sp.]
MLLPPLSHTSSNPCSDHEETRNPFAPGSGSLLSNGPQTHTIILIVALALVVFLFLG